MTSTPEFGLPSDLEVIRQLGAGQVATVLLAREPALKRLVAIKLLRGELAQNDTACRRFEREAQATASIKHPNVISVYRVGRTTADTPFIVMEYIDGRTLDDVLKAEGTYSLPETHRVLTSIAEALTAAHRKGVIHRDVRAGNVMLESGSDRVVLLDFGFAALLDTGAEAVTRLTLIGEKIGNPLRMSPEQRAGEPATQQTDIYALGLLGFELLTGRVPSTNPAQLRGLRPDIDSGLFDLIARCLAPAPRHRPTAAAVVDALLKKSRAPISDGNLFREFVRELKKRKVFRALFAYVAGAIFLLQVAQLLLPGLPIDDKESWYRGLVALTLAGFPVAIALSWLFDWSSDGLRRADSVTLRGLHILLPVLGLALTVGAAVALWFILMA